MSAPVVLEKVPPQPRPEEGPGSIRSLADLLAPVSTEEFYRDYWGRKPLYIPGTPDKFTRLMSWERLTELLNQTALWSPNTLKLMMDAEPVPARDYCRADRTREGPQGLVVDLSKIRPWLRRGASLVLNQVDSLTPGLREMASGLAKDTCAPIQSNLYCSWRAHKAFPVHFDTHDVFALQIAGHKKWRIFQRHFEAPVQAPMFKNLEQSFHEKHKGQLTQTIDMQTGNVLYIPRGYYHDALATDEASIHLSTAVQPTLGLDLVTALYERALLDTFMRKPIPNPDAEGDAAFDQHLEALVKRVGELFSEPSFRKHVRDLLAGPGKLRTQVKLPDDGAS